MCVCGCVELAEEYVGVFIYCCFGDEGGKVPHFSSSPLPVEKIPGERRPTPRSTTVECGGGASHHVGQGSLCIVHKYNAPC